MTELTQYWNTWGFKMYIENKKLIGAICFLVTVCVLPWVVWVTNSVFEHKSQLDLLKQNSKNIETILDYFVNSKGEK